MMGRHIDEHGKLAPPCIQLENEERAEYWRLLELHNTNRIDYNTRKWETLKFGQAFAGALLAAAVLAYLSAVDKGLFDKDTGVSWVIAALAVCAAVCCMLTHRNLRRESARLFEEEASVFKLAKLLDLDLRMPADIQWIPGDENLFSDKWRNFQHKITKGEGQGAFEKWVAKRTRNHVFRQTYGLVFIIFGLVGLGFALFVLFLRGGKTMTSQAVVASSADWPMFWVQLIYTITTMLILIAAVWGERLRRWLSGPCFITTLNDPIGVLVYRNDGKPAWWFHLRVRNICAYTTATATVYCTKIERWDNTLHRWIDEAFPGSLPLCWAYSSVYGIQRVVGSDACIDLCYINANEDKLQFHFGFRPNNITPFLRKDERVKLHLSVEADGYLQSRVDCYELSWNGLWSDSKDDMFRNVTIQPIKDGMVVRNSDKDRKNKT